MKAPIRIIEGELEFLFDGNVWEEAIKFDEHPDYRNMEKIGSLQNFDKEGNIESSCGIKAIDFLGIQKDEKLFFIEVKDFKTYRIENKERLKNAGENLMTEIAYKVKDSLACIMGAQLNSTHHKDFWKSATRFIIDEKKDIIIILWLELDSVGGASGSIRNRNRIKKRKDSIADYRRKLRQKLKWLIEKNSNIRILNIENYKGELSFEVKRLPITPDTP